MKKRMAPAGSVLRQVAVVVAGALLVLVMAAARAAALTGGELIDPATAPWFAVVDGECGGTLVAPDRVLTAAQCVWGPDTDPPADVQLGAVVYTVVRIAMHPGWRHQNGGNFRDDVAILQLNEPVAGVQPVALGAEASATVRIIGEGAIRTSPDVWDFKVRQALLKPVADAACARAFRHYRGNNGERFDAKRMRCATDVDGRRPFSSACTSDEGGPLLDAVAPTPVLLGVVSWHDKRCGGDRRPTVFADIGHYWRFITSPNPIWAPKPVAQNTITGERRPGSNLYCGPPPYDVAPARLFFEWYRVTGPRFPTDSADFLGELVGRKAAYRIKSRDRGRELGCKIVATNNGGLAESDSPVIRIPQKRAKPAYATRAR